MTALLQEQNHVHLVGIGGIGMSALARWLLARGYTVSGSDRAPGEQGRALQALGARVYTGHAAAQVDGADLVVASSAVPPENPELAAAGSAGLPIIKRAALLGAIMATARGVAIAGTHGKTTTSALLGWILEAAGLDPTVLLGGVNRAWQSNALIGGGQIIVAEADEYDASFLQLSPELAIITNVESDHLDYYGSEQSLREAFRQFAASVTGTVVFCADDPVLPDLVGGIAAATVGYGLGAGTWRASDLEADGGGTSFTVSAGSETWRCRSPLAGRHNVANALAAIAGAHCLGVEAATAAAALECFPGVERRAELKGEAAGVLVIDDYAHHPTEIQATLAALAERYDRPIRVAFQPHTYSRTSILLEDFAPVFSLASAVYLLNIYAAREVNTYGVSSDDLAKVVAHHHPCVRVTGSPEATLDALASDVRPGDIVVTMGAGDVYLLGPQLLCRLENA